MATWRTPIYRELSRRLADVVGGKTAGEFAKLGINTVDDLVRHVPRRYIAGTVEDHIVGMGELQLAVEDADLAHEDAAGAWRELLGPVLEHVVAFGEERQREVVAPVGESRLDTPRAAAVLDL